MSVPYAKWLVGISEKQMAGLEALVPPRSKEEEFDAYLDSRREVARLDQAALDHAEAGESTAYASAYARRNDSETARQRLADEIGFEVCSQPSS